MNARNRIRALTGERVERSWYRINAAATADGDAAEVFIYDEIDSWFGVSAEQFARDLGALDAPEINVRINSPGGNVFDGIAIMNSIAGHDAKVTTIVDGLAASAASFIALAGDEVVMRPGAEMMIHDAWGLSVGNADDMRSLADQLDRTSNTLAGLYAAKTGDDVDDMRALMRAETWFSADEAVAAGLADRVEAPAKDKDKDKAANAKARVFDLSVFNFAGRSSAPAPRLNRSPSARVRAEVTPGKEGTMPTLIEGLRERLGLSDDADEAAVLEAVSEQLDSVAAAVDEPGPLDAPTEPTLAQLANSAKRLNLKLVDAGQYDQLSRQAAQGAQAFAAQQEQHRNSVLDKAIREGRISRAQRETYARQMDRDPADTEAFLESLPKNTAVAVEEMGHAGEPDGDPIEAQLESVFAKITGQTWNGENR